MIIALKLIGITLLACVTVAALYATVFVIVVGRDGRIDDADPYAPKTGLWSKD